MSLSFKILYKLPVTLVNEKGLLETEYALLCG
jgi:hypothetical protein